MKQVCIWTYKIAFVIYHLAGFALAGLIFKYLRIETPMLYKKWRYEGKKLQKELDAQYK